MAQLVVLEGFKVIALKDEVKLDDEFRRQLLNTPMYEVPTSIIDIPTSLILNIEIPKISLYNRPFANKASWYYQKTTSDEKGVHVYPQYVIKDNMVPYLIQDSGLNIVRESHDVFVGRSEKADYAFELFDANGDLVAGTNVSRGMAGEGKIIMCDEVVVVPADDYQRAQEADRKLNSCTVPLSEISLDYLSLALLVKSFYDVADDTKNVFQHEIKHCKNGLLTWPRLHKDEVTEFSGLDCWRTAVDDEFSAKIEEAIEGVNAYLKKGQAADLNAFKDVVWIQSWLHSMDDSQRMDAVMNIPEVVRRTYDWWMEKMYPLYSRQFETVLGQRLSSYVPARKLRMESDGTEYEKWRHLLFNYSVYNPATGHYVNMDLSEHVPLYNPTYDERGVIRSLTQETIERNNSLHLTRGRYVSPELLSQALELRQAAIEQTPFMQRMKTMMAHENLSVAGLFDLRDSMVIVDESQEKLGEKPQVHPQPEKTDKAGDEVFTIDEAPMAKKKDAGYEAFVLDDEVAKKKGKFLTAVLGMIDSARRKFSKKSDFEHE